MDCDGCSARVEKDADRKRKRGGGAVKIAERAALHCAEAVLIMWRYSRSVDYLFPTLCHMAHTHTQKYFKASHTHKNTSIHTQKLFQ